MRVRYFAVLAVAALCAGEAHAQAAACRRGCSPVDLNCKRLEADCMAKLVAYNGYMAQMAAGAQYFTIPRKYIDLLQPLYPNVDLATVRFALGQRQASRAVTDCHSIYFTDDRFVGRLRDGTLTPADSVLYHELRHAEQCQEAGGREAYAVMWWQDVDATKDQGGNPLTIHSRQPIENDARARTTRVVNAFPDGLVPPVALTALTASPGIVVPITTPITWTAAAGGGTGAIEFRFIVTRDGAAAPVTGTFGDDPAFRFTPTAEGRYRLSVQARQKTPRRAFAQMDTSFTVAGAGGMGGSPFSIACPAGHVLAGLEVRAAALVNAVQPVCARVEANGEWKVRAMSRTQTLYWISFAAWAGGSGGIVASLRCDPGWGVREAFGTSAATIRQLGVRCARLTGTAGGVASTGAVREYGPSRVPGSATFTLACPAGQVATGLRGRAGALVDQVSLPCGTVRP